MPCKTISFENIFWFIQIREKSAMGMAEKILFIEKSMNNVLNIRNSGSSFCQFYELNSMFMFVLEEFNCTDDYVNYSIIAPNYFFRDEEVLTSSFFSKTRAHHQHDFFEIMFVLKGSVVQKIEGQEYIYHKGQCCLLNHHVRHVEAPTEDTELFFLMLSDEFLDHLIRQDLVFDSSGHAEKNQNKLYQIFYQHQKGSEPMEKQYWDFYPIMPLNIIVPRLEELFAGMLRENKRMEPGSYLMIQALAAKVFSMMANPAIYSIRKTKLDGSKHEILFLQIRRILEERNGRVSRTELAEQLNYNDHYLNCIVKSATGMSLLEYGRLFTMKEAARLLVQTDSSILTIMDRLELTNRTAFYRAFKKQYGVTPSEYRRHAKSFFDTGFTL